MTDLLTGLAKAIFYGTVWLMGFFGNLPNLHTAIDMQMIDLTAFRSQACQRALHTFHEFTDRDDRIHRIGVISRTYYIMFVFLTNTATAEPVGNRIAHHRKHQGGQRGWRNQAVGTQQTEKDILHDVLCDIGITHTHRNETNDFVTVLGVIVC